MVLLLFLGFVRGGLVNLSFFKKKLLKHASARHGLCAIKVVHEGPCSGQSPVFIVALGATRCPLFNGRAHAHGGGLVELRWRFFPFFSLSFLRLKNLFSRPIIGRSFV